MLRRAIVIAMTVTLCMPFVAFAKEKEKKIKGHFSFIHGVPKPVFFGEQVVAFCIDGGVFDGKSTRIGPFEGEGAGTDVGPSGNPAICTYLQLDGTAEFSGLFEWVARDGSTLSGKFSGVDVEPIIVINGQPLVFATVIDVTFTGGTKRFANVIGGAAIATGIDDPFGVLSGNPEIAGVIADFAGKLTIETGN